MSKIEELKKQNPNLIIDFVDVIKLLLEKPKYVELKVNLSKKDKKFDSEKPYIKNNLRENFYISEEKTKDKSSIELIIINYFVETFIGKDNYEIFYDFMSYNERKLIENNDLSKYSSFDDVRNAVAIAELKSNTKEFEKEIVKLYETNEWLVLKPLSWEASKKYGNSTKWCTAARGEYYQFYRYSKQGILIYCLNKLTGKKVAFFKELDNEISFWNAEDRRIDSIESGLSIDVLDIIKNEIHNCKNSNFSLFSQNEILNYNSLMEDNVKDVSNELQVYDENHFRNNTAEYVVRDEPRNQLRIVYPPNN